MNDQILDTMPFLQEKYFNNTGLDYLMSAVFFCLAYLLLWVIKNVLLRRAARMKAFSDKELPGFIIKLLGSVNHYLITLVALYFASRKLDLPEWLDNGIRNLTFIVVTFQVVVLVSRLVRFLIQKYNFGGTQEELALKSTKRNLSAIAMTVCWITGILFMLSNLGININSFVTGLGIGGIAIALAAQAILGDVFSSFTIAIDKPFEIGDFIIIDTLQGTVEQIGLKTTRIRSLSGELLVMSNSDLTGSRIKNFKRMYDRRINFKIGVAYETPLATLKELPEIIKRIIEENKDTKFDRAHVMEFGESSLVVDIVYFVKSSEYNLYASIQQNINFRIIEELEKRKVAMAYPTRTVYFHGQKLTPGA